MPYVEGMLFPPSYLRPEFSPQEEHEMEMYERELEHWMDEHAHLLELPEAFGLTLTQTKEIA